MAIKVIDSLWYEFLPVTFGLVKAKDTVTGEIKHYAGVASGKDLHADVQHLIDMGTKLTPERKDHMIRFLGGLSPVD